LLLQHKSEPPLHIRQQRKRNHSPFQLVQWTLNISDALPADMGIAKGSLQAIMPQQFLNKPDISAAFQ
jgi:hypothetical protein